MRMVADAILAPAAQKAQDLAMAASAAAPHLLQEEILGLVQGQRLHYSSLLPCTARKMVSKRARYVEWDWRMLTDVNAQQARPLLRAAPVNRCTCTGRARYAGWPCRAR